VKWRAVGFLMVVVVVFAVGVLAGYRADHYRTARRGEVIPTPALVAKQLIPKGTPGSLVLSQSMYAATTLPWRVVEADAISDPTYLRGRASAVDILPGQQFTETNFTASDASASP
jgi:hypothetical protein